MRKGLVLKKYVLGHCLDKIVENSGQYYYMDDGASCHESQDVIDSVIGLASKDLIGLQKVLILIQSSISGAGSRINCP
jgi:hypothetical protein